MQVSCRIWWENSGSQCTQGRSPSSSPTRPNFTNSRSYPKWLNPISFDLTLFHLTSIRGGTCMKPKMHPLKLLISWFLDFLISWFLDFLISFRWHMKPKRHRTKLYSQSVQEERKPPSILKSWHLEILKQSVQEEQPPSKKTLQSTHHLWKTSNSWYLDILISWFLDFLLQRPTTTLETAV